ncbi:unnamed protein product [Ixodes pacificus]
MPARHTVSDHLHRAQLARQELPHLQAPVAGARDYCGGPVNLRESPPFKKRTLISC